MLAWDECTSSFGVNILKDNGEPLHHLPVGSGSDSTSAIVRVVKVNTFLEGREGLLMQSSVSPSNKGVGWFFNLTRGSQGAWC